jgi:hypothetical protein
MRPALPATYLVTFGTKLQVSQINSLISTEQPDPLR